MRALGRVASTVNRRVAYRVLVGILIKRDHLESLDVDGRLILRCIFKKWDEETVTVFLCLSTGIVGGLL